MPFISSGKRRENKILFIIAVSILLMLFLIIHPATQGLFFIISGMGSQSVSGFFRINTFPLYSNFGQSQSSIASGSPITLYSHWSDSALLEYVWLATNETGTWENRTSYGSPIWMNSFLGWSNFTWSNPDSQGTVCWRIYANDSLGNMNSTEAMCFQVIPPASKPQISETHGGGGTPALPSNFTLDKEFIKTSVKQGGTILEYIRISNTGGVTLDFNISIDGIQKNVMLSEDSFMLRPGESRSVTVAFTASDEMAPDIYSGRLYVTAANITKTAMLIMEVKAKKSLFDLYVSLPETPMEAARGSIVDADILMYNFGDIKPADVVLYYSLRDFDGNDLIFNHETIAVDEQRLVRRSIRIPGDLAPGFYLFYARINYSDQTATSSGLIKVVEAGPEAQKAEYGTGYMAIMLFSFAIILSILLFIIWKIRRTPLIHIFKVRRISGANASTTRLKKIKEDIEDLELKAGTGKQNEEKAEEIRTIRSDIRRLRKKGSVRR